MKRTLTIIPSIVVHPGQINLYNQIQWEPSKPNRENYRENNYEEKNGAEHLQDSKRIANGNVSSIAKRKMLKAINYLLFITNDKKVTNAYTGRSFKFKIAFVTLTLPSKQIHSDNEIKSKLLNQFLIELKKYHHVQNYVWRAEKQRNGNLHFHVIIDKFVDHQKLRDRWNRITDKLGYLERYRLEQSNWHSNGFRVRENLLKTWPLRKQRAAYNRGARTNWNSPNSTDIHSVHKIIDIKGYMSKYITKNEIKKISDSVENCDIIIQEGRIWACSQYLQNIKGARAEVDWKLEDEIQELVKSENVKVYKDTYFSIIIFDSSILLKRPAGHLFKLLSKYLFEHFNYSFQMEMAA